MATSDYNSSIDLRLPLYPDTKPSYDLAVFTDINALFTALRLLAEGVQEQLATKLEDAPEDGQLYGRKDGEWEVVSTSGGGGALLARASAQSNTPQAISTIIPFSYTTPPSNTAGDLITGMSIVYTPRADVNKIKLSFHTGLIAGDNYGRVLFTRSDNADALTVTAPTLTPVGQPLAFEYEMVAGTTSPITISVRAGANVSAIYFLRSASDTPYWGGSPVNIFTIEEYAP